MPKASPKKLRPIYSAKLLEHRDIEGHTAEEKVFWGIFTGNVWEFGNIRTSQFVGCLSLMVETMLEPPTSTITVMFGSCDIIDWSVAPERKLASEKNEH